MTKQFTTPCFIRKNTPELRKKLAEMGYNVAKNAYPYHRLSVNCYSQNGNCFGLAMTECNIFFNPENIDCGTNESLFLDLAAMRSDTDKGQFFVHNKNQYRWTLCQQENIRYDVAVAKDWHKATATEIIEWHKERESK